MAFDERSSYDLEEVQVGLLHIQILRFGVALDLGYDPADLAKEVSEDVFRIYSALQEDFGNIGDGMNQNCLMVSHLSFDEPYRGSTFELSTLRTALIGLSSGVSRVFLPLSVVNPHINPRDLKELNATALPFCKLGFKPLKLGSCILWLDLELLSFWKA
ncbi:hypothetical protein [Pseudomonas sp. GV071]|uniref:hypothetical protein n=1 Tax=Pseudomonas sp. GV071 TaxID=2135754 RepID=UPI000D4C475B|nr:hypothetical protein [Pseudomonas sp. GV071]PTQ66758.1 hypothetical protein C8K61_11930 [Pseudomonas sp. GV071]